MKLRKKQPKQVFEPLDDFTKDMFSLRNRFRVYLGKHSSFRPLITKDLVVLLNSICDDWRIAGKEWSDDNTIPSTYIIETIGSSIDEVYTKIKKWEGVDFPSAGITLMISDISSIRRAKIFEIYWDRKEKFYRIL